MNEPGTPPSNGLQRLAEHIFATEGGEITCDQAASLIGLCADLDLDDDDARQRYPALFQHLHFCPDCSDEYRMLTDYARSEAAGHLRSPQALPPLPAEFRASPLENLSKVLRSVFGGFVLAAPQHALRGERDRRQATIDLEGLQLVVDSETSPTDAELRSLHVRLQGAQQTSDTLLSLIAGGHSEQETTLDAQGEAMLLDVLPGLYELHLNHAGREYRIEQFEIP
jgi:hypothetical protein